MLFTSSSDGTTVTPTTPPDNGTDPTSGTDSTNGTDTTAGPSLVTGSIHILFDLCPLPFCHTLMHISSQYAYVQYGNICGRHITKVCILHILCIQYMYDCCLFISDVGLIAGVVVACIVVILVTIAVIIVVSSMIVVFLYQM